MGLLVAARSGMMDMVLSGTDWAIWQCSLALLVIWITVQLFCTLMAHKLRSPGPIVITVLICVVQQLSQTSFALDLHSLIFFSLFPMHSISPLSSLDRLFDPYRFNGPHLFLKTRQIAYRSSHLSLGWVSSFKLL